MEINKGFLGAKLRGSDGQVDIFLVGDFVLASPTCADLFGFCHYAKVGLAVSDLPHIG